MSDKLSTRVIQVSNIAPSCTKDQLRTLFGYLGRIRELAMYPPEGTDTSSAARVGYIEFEDSSTTGVSLHLSSTVFIDRAVLVVPVMDGKIPDESAALQLTPSAVAGMLPGQPTWPSNVVSQVTGLGANQVIMTNDPRLTSLGLPQYPPLPVTTDPSKIEEIRRTVYVSELDAKVTPEMLLSFFSQTGEIKYIRMAGDENAPTRSAYIEFTDQRCIAQALSYNNIVFHGRTVNVKHATTSIVKPTPKSEASQREIDDAMKKVKEASKLISAAANSEREGSRSPSRKRSKSRGRSRSRSKSRKSRSRSRGRRRKSRSRSRRRSRSKRRSPRRSRSPVRRRRSRSRSRRRSRTRSPPVRRRRSRSSSKSKARPRKSRTPPKSYSRNRRSRSRGRRSRSRDRKERKEKKKSRSMSPPTLVRESSVPVGDDGDKSPAKGNGRSPSPVKIKKRSPSPKRRSRSKSPSRRKKRRRSRSTSRKRSRSRSGSRPRNRREKKRSRSRDRKHESRKKSSRDKDERKKESSSKIKRDYDEEEKGFASDHSDEKDTSEAEGPKGMDSPVSDMMPPVLEKDTDHQTVDMDMSD